MVRIWWVLLLGCTSINLLITGFEFYCTSGHEPAEEPVYVEGVDKPICYCFGPGYSTTVFDWTFVHDTGRIDHIATCVGMDNCTTSYPTTVLEVDLEETYSTLSFSNLTTRFSGIFTCTQSNGTSHDSANYTLKVTRTRFRGCSEGINFPEGTIDGEVDCDYSPYVPHTVTWKLITRSGQPLRVGNCKLTKNYKFSCNSLLSPNVTLDGGDTFTNVYFNNGFINRDIIGAAYTVAFSSYTEDANCSMDVYSPAILENCSMEVDHHNWSFIVSCHITRIFSNQGHYLLSVSESFQMLMYDNLIEADGDSFEGFRSIRDYLRSYIDSSDKKEYFRGRVTLSWPIPPYPGIYGRFTVKTYHGSESHINFKEGFNVSLAARPMHNCSDAATPCSCSTETLGSPPGRLLWLIGNTSVAVGDHGVNQLLLPLDNLPGGQDVVVATCQLDWIQPLIAHEPFILRTNTDRVKPLAIVWTLSAVLVVLVIVCVGIFVHQRRLAGWARTELPIQQNEETETSSYSRLQK